MQRVILQVPMSKDLKQKAEIVSFDMGFSSLQEIIRVLLNKLARREFSISINDEIPNERLKKIFRQADKDLKEGKASPTFDNVEDAIAWLHRDK